MGVEPSTPGNTGLSEDERANASIVTGISTYVATAALAVLAGAVALFTYVTQTHTPGALFYVATVASAILLVASIFLGGKGTAYVAGRVADSSWNPSESPERRIDQYEAQATLTLLGLVAVLVAAAFGMTAPRQADALETRVERLERQMTRLLTVEAGHFVRRARPITTASQVGSTRATRRRP